MTRSQRWSLLAALVVVIILAVGWLGFISPEHSHKSGYESQAVAIDGQNASLRTKIAQLTSQKKHEVDEQNIIMAISHKVPATSDMASYVRVLQKAALDTGVDITSIAPQTPVPAKLAAAAPKPKPNSTAATSSTPPRPPSTGAAVTSSVVVIPISVKLVGGYEQVEAFLGEVEGLDRISEVTAINLTPGGKTTLSSTVKMTSPPPTWKTLNADISLDIFMTNAPLHGVGNPTPIPSPSH